MLSFSDQNENNYIHSF